MKNSGNDAGHPDESDLLDAQMNSGISLIRAGRARLRLAVPRYRDKIPSTHKLAFQSLRRVYEVTALMVDELRKEVHAVKNCWRNMKRSAAASKLTR